MGGLGRRGTRGRKGLWGEEPQEESQKRPSTRREGGTPCAGGEAGVEGTPLGG